MDFRINNNTSKKRKRNGFVDSSLKNTYGKWIPVKDINRSFFVWKGMFSGSFKELAISKILKSQNIRFYSEISFDLKTRFDFYIPLIDLVIEYDGDHHLAKDRIEKDILKEKQLQRLGVKLIRYNKSHNLKDQILYDLVNHPVLK